jgi:hypothetical protein
VIDYFQPKDIRVEEKTRTEYSSLSSNEHRGVGAIAACLVIGFNIDRIKSSNVLWVS